METKLYWDDVCYKKGHDDNDKPIKIFYSCYSAQAWDKHIATPKYKKMYKMINEDPNSIKCEHCNQSFSEEGYELHCIRNKPLWEMQKIGCCMTMGCNRFKEKGRRYESIDIYKASKLPKPKIKRTKVGQFNPVTGITRPPNKPDGWASNKELQMKEHYSLCKSCDGMLNNTTWEHSDEELMKLTSLTMCIGCEDEPNLELKIKDLKEGEWMTIQDKDEPTEEEWELIDQFGNMLDFEEVCDTCNLPINDEDYSTRLLTYLDLDVCECD